MDGGFPALLLGGKMNVTSKQRWPHLHSEAGAQKMREAMNAMDRSFVAPVDERIMTFNLFNPGIRIAQWRQVRVVLPQFRTGTADISQKLSRMQAMQITHCRSEHDQITWR